MSYMQVSLWVQVQILPFVGATVLVFLLLFLKYRLGLHTSYDLQSW